MSPTGGFVLRGPSSPPPGKRLVRQSDFVHIGTACAPVTLYTNARTQQSDFGAGLPGYIQNSGLASAVISGVPNLFSTADGQPSAGGTSGVQGELYRFTVPSISLTPPYPVVTNIQSFGDAYSCKRIDGYGNNCDNSTYRGPGGIYIQESGGQFYYWWAYNPVTYSGDGNACSLGRSLLNIGGGTGVGQAAYSFQFWDCVGRDGSLVPIPAGWRSLFGNHEMMLFNIGQPSHSNSLDPCGVAFDWPTGPDQSAVSVADYGVVIQFSFGRCTANSSTIPSYRMARPSWLPPLLYNYTPDADPNAGVCTPDSANYSVDNQFTMSYDAACQFVFIDTPNRYGILTANRWTLGGISYTAATINAGGATTGWGVLDPNKMAEIYAGTRGRHDIPYEDSWAVQYPVFDYNNYPFQNITSPVTVQGIASIDRVRVTYPSAPGYLAVGSFIGLYDPNFGGYRVSEVISPTVFDCCGGQGCNGSMIDFGPTPSNAGYESWFVYGKPVGMVWMPDAATNVLGLDNILCVATDAYNGVDSRRYFHFYQLN